MDTAAEFTFIDLFSGIGGFRLALDSLGGRCLGFSEVNKDAIECYCANFGDSPKDNFGDITKLSELPAHDLMTAGVPCQSWSIAGRNLGFHDDRGQLWNDTIFLLNKIRPKAFIFENVKGLADPRNADALSFIMDRIRDAGYSADFHVINSADLGVPQNRVRVYIIGFLDRACHKRFRLPPPNRSATSLGEIMGMDADSGTSDRKDRNSVERGISGTEYFLFNDIRNGQTTVHSWDIIPTTEREKHICLLLLRNRRKSKYGRLDGNPLSLGHLQELDSTVRNEELEELIGKGILKTVPYTYALRPTDGMLLTGAEESVLDHSENGTLSLDRLKDSKELRRNRVNVSRTIESLMRRGIISIEEKRYEFRYTKISTGIEGVNRVFMPHSKVFPTLVASDTNDFVALRNVEASTGEEFKGRFLQEIFHKGLYRRISKEEACAIQGFPRDFLLPKARSRWMKLVGNSVSVPVIRALAKQVLRTGAISPVEEEVMSTVG